MYSMTPESEAIGIKSLPDKILLKIFSFIPHKVIQYSLYWVTQKLPQIYNANYATFPIQIRKYTVQICYNFWVTQYNSYKGIWVVFNKWVFGFSEGSQIWIMHDSRQSRRHDVTWGPYCNSLQGCHWTPDWPQEVLSATCSTPVMRLWLGYAIIASKLWATDNAIVPAPETVGASLW